MRCRVKFLAILASSCLISSMGYSLPPAFPQHPTTPPPAHPAAKARTTEEPHGLAKSKQARISVEEAKK